MPEKEETVTEIAVKRNPGGTFEIPCDINGLPLQMIFDTGASDVTISSVVANFMFKNGYLWNNLFAQGASSHYVDVVSCASLTVYYSNFTRIGLATGTILSVLLLKFTLRQIFICLRPAIVRFT